MSGRWFCGRLGLDGPWTFATTALPADFARIPASGPRGFVRVSVPGTAEAQQALIDAQIPHQATLDRSTAKLAVVYAGAPEFEPIAGTEMHYAVNTSFDVIRVGASYYACWQGAWFAASAPDGPWTLAASVPAVIYTIPPASPVYRVTFVRVYARHADVVTYGYTAGYTMAYASAGVVVYGTGWYYPPVIIPGPIPIYYPYPYSYAGAVYYNPATGAWARGGAIYGPYGGVAKGGTAYNPTTGAWAHGGAVYGPNGGAGAVSAYNPSTGSYFHGSAAWGPDGGAGQRELVQRAHRPHGLDEAEQQRVRALGFHDGVAARTRRSTRRAGATRRAPPGSFRSIERREGRGRVRRGRQQRGRGEDRERGRLRGRRRQRVQEDGRRLAEVRQRLVELGGQADDAAHVRAIGDRVHHRHAAAILGRRRAECGAGDGAASIRRGRAIWRQRTVRRRGERTASAAAGGGSRFEGSSQLEQDRSARMGGGARQQQFESMRGGFEGRGGMAGGGFAGRGGGGFRR